MSSNPVVGIIAEYNPFHNGHAYQIARIRALLPDAALVAVMSGSFTQRGEPTVLDQWQRAALAIENGIDLVIELPYAFSCRSAQHFATGGIRLLAALGCVTHLAFGAETDDLPLLTQLAEASDLQAVKEDLHQRLKEGRSYAEAFAGAVAQRCSCPPSILRQPNNILAIEYLRARTHFAPKLHPLLIRREGADYHDENIVSNIASASAIRCTLSRLLSQEDPSPSWQELASVLPGSVWEALHSSVPLHFPRQAFLYRSLLTMFRTISDDDLRTIVGIREGLEHRLLRASRLAGNWQDLLGKLGTRRYPTSSLSRILLHLLLNFKKEDAARFDGNGPSYLRVLAMNDIGASLLHRAKERSTLPLLTKVTPFLNDKERRKDKNCLSPLQQMLRFDLLATELRELTLPQPNLACRDFLESPRFLARRSTNRSGEAEDLHRPWHCLHDER